MSDHYQSDCQGNRVLKNGCYRNVWATEDFCEKCQKQIDSLKKVENNAKVPEKDTDK